METFWEHVKARREPWIGKRYASTEEQFPRMPFLEAWRHFDGLPTLGPMTQVRLRGSMLNCG